VSLAQQHSLFPKDRSVTTSDGTHIAYTVLGGGPANDQKPPILFVNGWTCPDAYWVDIGPGMIKAGHRVIFMDTRGHGESGLPRPAGFMARNLRAEDVAPERMARDVIEVLDDAGVDRAVLAGHSMGVQIIVEAARRSPDRVAGLVPIAGTFENPVRTFADKAVLDSLYPIADVLFRFIPFELVSPVMRRIADPNLGVKVVRLIKVAGPKVTAAHMAPHIAQISEVNFSVLWRMMSALRGHSTIADLPNIKAPTLILAGRRDLFTPPSVQEKMAELIPDAEIVWFEEGGHLLPVEEPEGIISAMTEFLARRLQPQSADG
jgi:pimeloyl-ACP methyl ester carboxylesterase